MMSDVHRLEVHAKNKATSGVNLVDGILSSFFGAHLLKISQYELHPGSD